MQKMYKDKHCYFIIDGIGNMIYLPSNYQDLIEFIKDYLVK